MKKRITFTMFGLSVLLFVAASAQAGCGSGGGWGYSYAPTYHYQPYYNSQVPRTVAPAPAVAQKGYSYRSFSYDSGAAQPYYYSAPRSYSAPSGANDFRANRKMFGLSN